MKQYVRKALWLICCFAMVLSLMTPFGTVLASGTDGTVTVTDVVATPFIKMDGDTYIQETKLALTNTGAAFTANVRITVQAKGTTLVYETENVEVGTGTFELVKDEKGETVTDTTLTVYSPDTHELLKPEETATMVLELYDASTNTLVASKTSDGWQRTRHWQFYMAQKMHMDIGFNHTQWELPDDYSNTVMDPAKELVKTYSEENGYAVPYRYSIESSWMLTDAYMLRKSYSDLQELVDMINEGMMNVGAGWSNYTMEDFNTEENARAAYKTNRTLVDQLGIAPSEVQYMFDNPSFSKSWVDTAASAGIKYGMHAMNTDRSPYNQKAVFDLFYMQGNDPDNKLLIFNGAHYGTRYGFYFANEKDYQTDTAKHDLTKLMNDLEARTTDGTLPYYPYDLFPMTLVMQGDNQPPNKSQPIIADMLSKEWAEAGYVYPQLKSALPEEFFEDVIEQYGSYIPTRTGTEENWWNDGWATTAYDSGVNKQAGSELPVAESTAALNAALNGASYPIDDISTAWDRNLVFDEHTWGWRGIAKMDNYINCYEWKRSNAYAVRDLSDNVLDDSLQGLANGTNVSGQAIYVYNSLSWTRDDTVTIDDLSELPEFFEILDGSVSVPYTIQNGTLTFVANDVPALGYKLYTIHALTEAPVFDAPGSVEQGENYIQNEFYKVTFAADGTISSILDRKNGNKELVDSTADVKFNQYQYYDDHGFPQNPSTSFKITDDKWTLYQPQAEDSTVTIEENGISVTATVLTSTFRAEEIRQSVTLYDGIPRIDIENVVLKGSIEDLNKKEEAFYTFPFASSGNYEICYDLPQGNQVEGEQIYGTSHDFYTASKWVNVKDKGASDYNMAIALPNTSLLMFGERRTGQWDFDYVSSKPYIYSYVMNNQWWTNFQYDQPGLVNFNYSISTNYDAGYSETAHFAWEVCTPLEARVVTGSGSGSGAASGSYVEISQSNVVMTAMKPAESNGSGYILRFYELEGKQTDSVTVTLPASLHVTSVTETDIIENDLEDAVAQSGNSFTFSMKPYTMRTFRVEFGSAPAAPSNVAAEAFTAPTAGVKITWSPVSGASYYEVFRSTDDGSYYVGSTEGTSLFDLLAKGEGTFSYKVRAVSGGAKGSYSATVQAVSGANTDAIAPEKPILTGQPNSATRIDLSWTPVEDDVLLSKYEVWRAAGETSDLSRFSRIYTTVDNYMSTYRDTSLNGGLTFTYFVRAIDTAGNATDSNLITLSAYTGSAVEESLWLESLDVSPCTITPYFQAETYEYDLNFGSDLNKIGHVTLTPVLPESLQSASITVNGTSVASGESIYVPVSGSGDTVSVTIEKGISSQTYLLHVTDHTPVISIDSTLKDTAAPFDGTNIVAGSTQGKGTVVTHLIDGSGMSDESLTATHDNNKDAATMWQTGKNSTSDQYWLMVDLGKTYDLDQLYIWNSNQLALIGRGMKNISISYCSDGDCWKQPTFDGWQKLTPPADMTFLDTDNPVSEAYPFQLAKGTEEEQMAATNLNDGSNTPIDFGGVSARYVMIQWEPGVDKGNWGDDHAKQGPRYGLSEIRFTAKMTIQLASSLTVSAADGVTTKITAPAGQLQMKAATDDNATNRGVTWTVDSDIATISSSGLLTARKNGTVTVTATTVDGSNLSASCEIEIENQPEVIPVQSVRAGSEAEGSPAVNTINNSGMSGADSVSDTHDNAADGSTVWSTDENAPGSSAWIEFDLGHIYNVDQMWIWNDNQNGATDCGMQHVKIEYSKTGEDGSWKELRGAGAGSGEYPYTFEQASGSDAQRATNLLGGTPVQIGAVARFIRITADPAKEQGSYMGESYGLSEVRFTKVAGSSDEPVSVEDIRLNQEELILPLNGTEELQARITPDNATDQEVLWSSADPAIADVSETGLVTAVAAGTTTITATAADGGKTAVCYVTVLAADVMVKTGTIHHSDRTLTEGELNKVFYAGDTWKFDDAAGPYCGPDADPEDGSQYYSFTFTGEQFTLWAKKYKNVGLVHIYIDGVLTDSADLYDPAASAKGTIQNVYTSPLLPAGEHTVRVVLTGQPSPNNPGGKANMDFSYAEIFERDPSVSIPVGIVTLEPASLRMQAGSTETLHASVWPSIATNPNVTWSSSDDSVAAVSENGVVTALSAGMATIAVTAADSGASASCQVTVDASEVQTYTITVVESEGGQITPGTTAVTAGESQTFAIAANPGYVLSDVLVDGQSVGAVRSYTFEDVQEDHTITAVFTKSVTPPTPGEGGSQVLYTISVTQSAGGRISPASASVKEGADVTFTIQPDEGYRIADVLVDGVSVGAVSTYTFRNVSSRHYITAVFEKLTGKLPFVDVPADSWFRGAVEYVYENGIMTGVDTNRFDPNGSVSRAMVWTVLARMEGVDTNGGDTWYAKARTWAMTNGVSDGTDPMGSVTREQLAAMLYRYSGSPVVSGSLNAYPDGASVSSWAKDAMVWATRTGLITGTGDGALAPQAGATRSQLATILMRFCTEVLN